MDEISRNDIRRLLKTFGIAADEAITAHLSEVPGKGPLRVRLILQDLTEYGDLPPQMPLKVEIEGEVRR